MRLLECSYIYPLCLRTIPSPSVDRHRSPIYAAVVVLHSAQRTGESAKVTEIRRRRLWNSCQALIDRRAYSRQVMLRWPWDRGASSVHSITHHIPALYSGFTACKRYARGSVADKQDLLTRKSNRDLPTLESKHLPWICSGVGRGRFLRAINLLGFAYINEQYCARSMKLAIY